MSDAAIQTLRSRLTRELIQGISGRSLALDLDHFWGTQRGDGPIDVVDFFSGCGGMSAGFSAFNAILPAYRLALAVDIDDDANATYERNLGLRPQTLDIRALSADLSSTKKLIDSARSSKDAPLVMIGCAPCQGFSSHRNAAGRSDERNSLFLAFAKIAGAIQPDAVVIENVPEILTDQYWSTVDKGRKILAKAGYKTIVAVHDMTHFGLPQHRYRALIIGMRRDFSMPSGFLDRDFRTVRHAIGGLRPIRPGEVCSEDSMHFTAGHRQSTIETIKAVPIDGGSRPADVGPDCLRRAKAKNGRAVYEDVYGRLSWEKPSITVTAYARNPASGRYVHPEQHRGLSVREAALLQGFPRSYLFEGSFDSKFRQIGNAVPPSFAAFLANHLLVELTKTPDERVHDQGIEHPIGPSFSRLIPSLKAGFRQVGHQPVPRPRAA